MALSTNDLRNGMALDLSDGLFTVVEFQHVKPGKGGAFVRTKLRNMRTKAVIEKTFRADEKVEQAVIDKREMQYLYRDGEQYVFMDNSTYDQMHVEASSLADAASDIAGSAPVDRAALLSQLAGLAVLREPSVGRPDPELHVARRMADRASAARLFGGRQAEIATAGLGRAIEVENAGVRPHLGNGRVQCRRHHLDAGQDHAKFCRLRQRAGKQRPQHGRHRAEDCRAVIQPFAGNVG